jgi:hypothetical protein
MVNGVQAFASDADVDGSSTDALCQELSPRYEAVLPLGEPGNDRVHPTLSRKFIHAMNKCAGAAARPRGGVK